MGLGGVCVTEPTMKVPSVDGRNLPRFHPPLWNSSISNPRQLSTELQSKIERLSPAITP